MTLAVCELLFQNILEVLEYYISFHIPLSHSSIVYDNLCVSITIIETFIYQMKTVWSHQFQFFSMLKEPVHTSNFQLKIIIIENPWKNVLVINKKNKKNTTSVINPILKIFELNKLPETNL